MSNFKKIRNLVLIFPFFIISITAKEVTISKDDLLDKIKGGWAGQTIGCTFGGPTEFRFQSTLIPEFKPLEWNEGLMKWWYENAPGLYDDIYMDLTFVEVFERKGLDAPAEEFARAFANAEYTLWHANQAARYNILNGIMPPKSGHWLHNPHAEDIDFQIEADFAGLMSPGMVNTSSKICDRIGHIMNYGDGWYGGVYVAAMYALAFISDDIPFIVEEGLKVIPSESHYYQAMSDVIRWHREDPDDWKSNWFNTQRKWGHDIGCPDGVFHPFNIDAKMNSAWIILGLLYGEGDFGKTISISTRAGDDSDCNPASSGGILGTILGYKKIPEFWKQGLADVEPIDFKYTTMSLLDTYEMSYKHALELIKKNGGEVREHDVTIQTQEPNPVQLEIGFEGHYPIERRKIDKRFINEFSAEFDGIGFTLQGSAQGNNAGDHVFEMEIHLDGKLLEVSQLPIKYLTRKNTLAWRYQLPDGKHHLKLKILNQSDQAWIQVGDLIVYGDKLQRPEF
jgi:hypothetical protein